MQRIVSLLIFQSAEPIPLTTISPWVERRFPDSIESVVDVLEKQAHRRAVKTHLPFDGIPVFDEVKYIHVSRDGRDACISYHNHLFGFSEATLARLDREGFNDPLIGRPYPRAPSDPAQFFHEWLAGSAMPGQEDGFSYVSYFDLEDSYWSERQHANLLFVHYGDMLGNLAAEMRRVAEFLEIRVPEEKWPSLIEAAGLETMRKQGATLMPNVTQLFDKGAETFFNKGTNGRWRGIFREDDLKLYDAKIARHFSRDCATWHARGRAASDEPASRLNQKRLTHWGIEMLRVLLTFAFVLFMPSAGQPKAIRLQN